MVFLFLNVLHPVEFSSYLWRTFRLWNIAGEANSTKTNSWRWRCRFWIFSMASIHSHRFIQVLFDKFTNLINHFRIHIMTNQKNTEKSVRNRMKKTKKKNSQISHLQNDIWPYHHRINVVSYILHINRNNFCGNIEWKKAFQIHNSLTLPS